MTFPGDITPHETLIIRQQLRIAQLEKTLEFYADQENWVLKAKPISDFILDCGPEVYRDFGQKARQVLNKV